MSCNGSSPEIESTAQTLLKLTELKENYGFREPDRGNLDDPAIKWRNGKPDYTRANCEFLRGKTQNHGKGSLEEVVENLVKTWEAEASHFKDFYQWTTIDHADYNIRTNGGETISGKVASEIGNYNALMKNCPAYERYGKLDFEASHDLFRNAFQKGFPWEVLRVFSKPPEVLLAWRHWGEFVGEYQGNRGHGETIEMYGLLRVTLNEEMKINLLEVFYDPDTFIEVMEGRKSPNELKDGVAILGNIKKTAVQKLAAYCKP